MEQRNAVPQGTARPRPPRTAEERQRDRRLALSLLTRLAGAAGAPTGLGAGRLAPSLLRGLGAAAEALRVLRGVVLLVPRGGGQDMFPAVKDGDLLIAYRLQRRWAQDDLVLYRQEGVLRLGRVAAVGGDVVMLEEDGTLRVNGTLHAGEVLYPTYPAGGVTYPYTVPEGCLFILNDYRTRGRDSRHFGAVPQQDAAGKVITLLRRRGL